MKKRNRKYKPKLLTIPMMFVVGTVADKYPLMADSLLAQITSEVQI